MIMFLKTRALCGKPLSPEQARTSIAIMSRAVDVTDWGSVRGEARMCDFDDTREGKMTQPHQLHKFSSSDITIMHSTRQPYKAQEPCHYTHHAPRHYQQLIQKTEDPHLLVEGALIDEYRRRGLGLALIYIFACVRA